MALVAKVWRVHRVTEPPPERKVRGGRAGRCEAARAGGPGRARGLIRIRTTARSTEHEHKVAMSRRVLEVRDQSAERNLCLTVLKVSGSIAGAAQLLGVTCQVMKLRIVKYSIQWPPPPGP